jgi:deoxyribonuclease-1-like protein
MRQGFFRIGLAFLIFSIQLNAQSFTLISWNIQDLGQSKNDEVIEFIASVLKVADIIAIQEVVAKHPGGAKAVTRIVDALNRKGAKWDYHISDPTQNESSQKRERYAFIWKTSSISNIGNSFLCKQLEDTCVREPFIGQFKLKKADQSFYLVNYHSRVFTEKPEEEIKHFIHFPKWLKSDKIIIAGDFNRSETHEVFDLLYKRGYKSAIQNSPTTLKRTCIQHYLNHPIDNIYFQTKFFKLLSANAIDFVKSCDNLELSRKISDHLPVYLKLNLIY